MRAAGWLQFPAWRCVVRRLRSQRNFLARRQPNGAHQCQLLFGVIIARDDQLLLPVLEFHPGAQRVDRRAQPRILLVGGLTVERLRVLQLRFCGFHPRRAAERLQIGIAGRQHHQVTGILVAELRRSFVFPGSALPVQGFEVQDRLAKVDSGVGKSVRANNSWKSGEPQATGHQIVLHRIDVHSSRTLGRSALSSFHFSPRAAMVL